MLTLMSAAKLNAQAGFSTEPRYEQRQQYQEAISAIKSGHRKTYEDLAARLTDYPLYPYLEYTDKIYRLSKQKPEAIAKFLTQWRDTPLSRQLRQNWLYQLGKTGRWQVFLDFYEGDESKVNECFHALALIKTGDKDTAWVEATRLWQVPYSQPDECDPVFKAWRDAGQMTPALAWTRYSLAIKENEITLGTYLTRYLDRSYEADAVRLRDVHINPARLLNFRNFDIESPLIRDIVLHGLTRLLRKSPEDALTAVRHYQATMGLTAEETGSILESIGIRIANKGDKDNLLADFPLDLSQYPDLVASRIRLALRQGDFGQALVFINLLPDSRQQTPRWLYWKARILEKSDNLTEKQIAADLYQQIAPSRNFYSFLAADKLGLPYQFENTSIAVTDEEILALESTPGVERALELFAMGDLVQARREWNHITRIFSHREKLIAAKVSQKWGWHKQAIQAMIDAQSWNDLDIRFPLAYFDTFLEQTRKIDIPTHWSMAIARQESAFMADAKSGAGALGLMQLMPDTARLTARRYGVSLDSSQELIDPHKNIRLGTAYLGTMLRRFNNNRVLASAAYNAGPTRVNGWMDASLALDVWIETIPFTETRNYVQNVLMFSAIYGLRTNQPVPLLYPAEWADFADANPEQAVVQLDKIPPVVPRPAD